jgi:3-deoxy-7-phosphoheptulonate synthase
MDYLFAASGATRANQLHKRPRSDITMIVILDEQAPNTLSEVRHALAKAGAEDVHMFTIGDTTVLMPQNGNNALVERITSVLPSARTVSVNTPSPLADRKNFAGDTVVTVGPAAVGGPEFAVMAGPCAVEDVAQLRDAARAAKAGGAVILRGGAYKPRTSPHAFQGIGYEGVKLLASVGHEMGMPVVSEVVDPRDVEDVAEYVDILQVGARNAQNFALLTELGRSGNPVLLKRGFGCNIDEWLGAAEYILREGNSRVILCERGIRTFEGSTRFTLDLAGVAVVKRQSHLPVIVDPSHGTGDRELTAPLALAAAAVGADGLIVDVHTNAREARCDGAQALSGGDFHSLMARLSTLVSAIERPLAQIPATVPTRPEMPAAIAL